MPVILDYGLRLDIHRLTKQALQQSDCWRGAWGWSRDGKTHSSITYEVKRQGLREARLHLSYTRNREPMAYDVRLVAEPCRFGGSRWFAICPATGLRVSKLYLPPGARQFLARKAWKLAYASQNVAPGFDRLCDQRDRLLAKKLKSNDPDLPLKPKGMRWRTYERQLEKLEYLQTAMDLAILQRFGMTAEAIFKNSGNFDRKKE